MRKTPIALALLVVLSAFSPAFASDPAVTVVEDQEAMQKVLGGHMFSLQWISWGTSGRAEIKEKNGKLTIKGMQKSQSGDYVSIEGWITHISATEFTVKGTVITKVATVNGGLPCGRAGEFTFAAKGKDKYWRIVHAENPCDPRNVDYIDIYFK
jgi:hypothetical protein